MSTLTDRTIDALQRTYRDLAALVPRLGAADLDRVSGSSPWDVAQVLSHLGSASEIGLATLDGALAGRAAAGQDANRVVWARWDAMDQAEKAAGYVEWAGRLAQAYADLDAQTRADLRITLAFLPAPVDLAVLTGMQLNEALMHAWDVRVAFDDAAALPQEDASVLLDQFRGPLGFLVGFLGRPAALDGRHAQVRIDAISATDGSTGLSITDTASITTAPADPDAVLSAPTEAFLRLVSGRLPAERTPDGVHLVAADLTLADLRAVFPGY